MQALSRMGDLLLLNFITVIYCIPVFTIGAAMTALHTVLLKMARHEEGYVIKPYFKAFKDNFKDATLVWLICLLILVVMGIDLYLVTQSDLFPQFFAYIMIVVAALILMIMIYIFPLVARFKNTIRGYFTNAAALAIAFLPRSLAMLAICTVPVVILYFIDQLMFLLVLFGLSAPAYACAFIYSPLFKKLEGNTEPEITPDDQFTIPEEDTEETVTAE